MSTTAEITPRLETIIDRFEQGVKALVEECAGQGQVTLAELESRVQAMGREMLGAVLSMAVDEVPVAQPTHCVCGHALQPKGRQERCQETAVGPIRWTRQYYYCPHCGTGHYPLDEHLRVAPGQFSERLQEGMAMAGASLPYAQAAMVCSRLLQVEVSPKTVERVTKRRGAQVGAARQAEEERALTGEAAPGASPPHKPPGGHRWVVGLDGVKVRFRDGWHEVVTGNVYRVGPDGRAEAQSYVARTGGLAAAGGALYVETLRRGIDPGRERLGCLADGAPGNWGQMEEHFPLRREILDWYHGMEHVWMVGRALFGQESAETQEWVKAREQELWLGRPEAVCAALQAASSQTPGGDVAAQQQAYFTSNAERMRYDRYRAEGWPIGSGPLEATCKNLVGARLKGAGMSWSTPGAQAVLNLRVELLSNRWQEGWGLSRLPKS